MIFNVLCMLLAQPIGLAPALVLAAQEVVNLLDGVEGLEGNLYEERVPVVHRSVP